MSNDLLILGGGLAVVYFLSKSTTPGLSLDEQFAIANPQPSASQLTPTQTLLQALENKSLNQSEINKMTRFATINATKQQLIALGGSGRVTRATGETVYAAATENAIAYGTKKGTIVNKTSSGSINVTTGGHYAKQIVGGKLTSKWVKD